jgi:hypothetical protein
MVVLKYFQVIFFLFGIVFSAAAQHELPEEPPHSNKPEPHF